MCINRDNTSDQELAKMRKFLDSMEGDTRLKQFLETVYDAVANHDGFCFQALSPEDLKAADEMLGDAPTPGIYAPGTFNSD